MTTVGLSSCTHSVWALHCVPLIRLAFSWDMLPFLSGPVHGALLRLPNFCAHWWEYYSPTSAGALLGLGSRLCTCCCWFRMIVLNLRPYSPFTHVLVWSFCRKCAHPQNGICLPFRFFRVTLQFADFVLLSV